MPSVKKPSLPSLEDALDDLPLFPLPQVVLFPDAPLPLHIFEPRYRKMLADCLASHKAIAIAQIVSGATGPRIAEVVGGGIIVEHQSLPDGRSNIVVLGQARLRIEDIAMEELPDLPYKRARVRMLSDLDVEVSESDRAALVAAATMFATEVKKHDPQFGFRVPSSSEAGRIADTCAYQLVVDATVRQAILEELDPRARVHMVTNQLALQHGAMLSDAPGRVLN